VYILAVVAKINAEIQKIVFSTADLVQNLLEFWLSHLIRDIAQHHLLSGLARRREDKVRWTYCGADIQASIDAFDLDHILRLLEGVFFPIMVGVSTSHSTGTMMPATTRTSIVATGVMIVSASRLEPTIVGLHSIGGHGSDHEKLLAIWDNC
jgi:hypothetical protein